MLYSCKIWKASGRLAVLLLLLVLPVATARAQTTNYPPNAPQLVAPTDGVTNVASPVVLDVVASDVDGDRLTVIFYGRQAPTAADFVLAIYGDTQNYYSTYTSTGVDYFTAQSQWVVTNRLSKNIAFVGHMGDVTNTNVDPEWSYASNAMAPLENPVTTGLPFGIPFDVAVGNHDELGGTALYNTYFGTSRFSNRDYYGGHYSITNDDHYEFFSAGGMDFILIDLVHSPGSSELNWANQLLQQYSDRRAIVITHELITSGDPASWSGHGQTVYDTLKANPNLFLMLSGHNGGEGKRTDVYNGKTVYTLMTDYSSKTNGGNGYIRLLTFSPTNNNIHVTTYSPIAGTLSGSAVWDLPYQMGDDFAVVGTTTVAAGSNATTTWDNLAAGTQYQWYATVNDSAATTVSPGWTFTSASQIPPAAPSALTATPVSIRQVNLTWTDNANNATEFEIERSLDGTSFTTLTLVGANITTYSDTGLVNGTSYYYRVRASNEFGTSGFSNAASAMIASAAPAAPSSLTATADVNRINLAWTDNSSNEDGFTIERSSDDVSFNRLATTAPNAATYSDSTVLPAKTYSYRVLAFNSAGISNYSNVASAAVSQAGFTPVADTNIRPDYPSSNFGADADLKVDGSPVKEALLRFVVSGILGKTVTNASLQLFVSGDGAASGGSFYRIADNSWTEAGVTWNNAPAADATPITTLGKVKTGSWYSVDLSNLITGDGTYSLLIKTASGDGVYYSSKEGPNPPQLILTVQDNANLQPTGGLDGISLSEGAVRGWAYDPDTSSVSSKVKLFVDGTAGQVPVLADIPTSALRADINSAYNVTGNHGFEYLMPSQYRDGASHAVYAYAADTYNDNSLTLLAGSPKVFTLPPSSTPSFRFASWSDAQDGGYLSYLTSIAISTFAPSFTIFAGDLSDEGVVLSPASSPYSMQTMSSALKGNAVGVGTNDDGVFGKTLFVRGNHDDHNANPGEWQTFFTSYAEAQGTMADRVARVGGHNYTAMSGQDDLTYSFDYSNSRFIMIDVPGSSDNLSSSQIAWADQQLTDAEINHPELVHSFISFHGPLYCVANHCNCPGQRASCMSSTADALVQVINNHPVVTALFHGHEHNLGWTHLDSTRISDLTHPIEQFITAPSGQPTDNQLVQFDGNGVPYRFDYVETSIEDQAFGIVDVIGSSYMVSLYRKGSAVPSWTGTFTKSVAPPPSAPSSLAGTAAGSTQINLTWTDNADNESAFRIERSLDGNTFTALASIGANNTSYSDTELTDDTAYYYRVLAFNAGGNSAFSNTATAKTDAIAPAAPSGLTATAVSSSQINLAWVDNASNEEAFQIERSSDNINFTPTARVNPNSTAYNDSGLIAGTTYYYRVMATNSGGDSGYSNIASASTAPAPPAAPTNLIATAGGSTQVSLSWTDNADNENGFRIERSLDGSTFSDVATTAANVSSYTDNSVVPATTYQYHVLATNSGGDSAFSNTSTVTTAQLPPLAPSGLTATAAGSTQINLTWTDNADNESGFRIERSPDGTTFTALASVGANVSSYSDTGLTAATTYYYRVLAFNAGGDSGFSTTASAKTDAVIPAAPSSLTAAAAGSSQINLGWTDNASNEDGLAIERSEDNNSFVQIATLAADVTSYSDTGLGPATLYYYRVSAFNAAGNSTYSNVAHATTGQVAPAAPSGLTATAAGSSQVELAWMDGSNNEEGFKIERSPDGASFAQIGTVAANVVSYSDSTAAAGTTYYYRVRAYNTAGDSEFSNLANATTAQVIPAAPGSLTASAVGSTQVNLTWTASGTVDGFDLERSLDGVSFNGLATLPGTATSYSNSGLTPATIYYYRVRAFNSAGASDYSSIAQATTAQVPPAAPTNLTATAAGSSQINLAWADNAGNEEGYRIERSPDGSSFSTVATTAANVSSYSDGGLTAATTYYYRVHAYNAAGDSGYSNVASASTGQVAPAAPSGLTATAVSSSQINLAWVDNASNEEAFQIERSSDNINFTPTARVNPNSTAYNDSGLIAGTTYYYRVMATNSGGDSGYSNIASATTASGGVVTVIQQNQNSGLSNSFGKATGTQQIFESITVPAGQLAQTRFYLSRGGTPTDSVRVEVRNLSGTLVATSSALSCSRSGFYTFVFSPTIPLAAGKYHFVLSRTGALNDTNFYYVREYGSDVYPNGNAGSSPQTSWSPTQWTWDLEFYVDYWQ